MEQQTTPYPKVKNTNLFRDDEFYCPICGEWKKGRSRFLTELFKDKENSCYIAQLITEIKYHHFHYNWAERIKSAPEMNGYCNCKALNTILDDENCLAFVKKQKISVDDCVKACKEINPKLKEKVLRKLGGGLVWR